MGIHSENPFVRLSRCSANTVEFAYTRPDGIACCRPRLWVYTIVYAVCHIDQNTTVQIFILFKCSQGMSHTYNPSAQETEVEGSEFKVILSYVLSSVPAWTT